MNELDIKRMRSQKLVLRIFCCLVMFFLTTTHTMFGLAEKSVDSNELNKKTNMLDLKFYQHRKPEIDLERALEKKDFRFKIICGISCWAPGGKTESSFSKFIKKFGGHVIDNTGDLILDDEHLVLKKAVQQYATIYNQLLFKKLKKLHMI